MSDELKLAILRAIEVAEPCTAAAVYAAIARNDKPGFAEVYMAIHRLKRDGLLHMLYKDGRNHYTLTETAKEKLS